MNAAQNPADITTTRTAPGVYTVRTGGHSFFVMRGGRRTWTIDGLDDRTEDEIKRSIFAVAESIVNKLNANAPSLKIAIARIEAAVFN